MRLVEVVKKFSEYDFMRLFLADLVSKGITKIDVNELKFQLVKYYKDERYRLLFEEISLKQQIEGDFLELDDCLLNARLYGLLSNPIQKTNKRKIFIEEPSKIFNYYSDEYKNHMHELVSDYINELSKPKIAFVGSSKKFMNTFIEKLNNDEFLKDICPQVGEEFILNDNASKEEIRKYNELLNSGILNMTSEECLGYIYHDENGLVLKKRK